MGTDSHDVFSFGAQPGNGAPRQLSVPHSSLTARVSAPRSLTNSVQEDCERAAHISTTTDDNLSSSQFSRFVAASGRQLPQPNHDLKGSYGLAAPIRVIPDDYPPLLPDYSSPRTQDAPAYGNLSVLDPDDGADSPRPGAANLQHSLLPYDDPHPPFPFPQPPTTQSMAHWNTPAPFTCGTSRVDDHRVRGNDLIPRAQLPSPNA
ncbi:hypothetical protein FRC11_002907 [Ceratobasidium sp. 423]|nr:hypothetical protein FRC11_002907 [Ceratobasidium sp. 423]